MTLPEQSDLVTRLRGWRNWREVHIVRTHLLLEEAAAEIERLSENGDCPAQDNASNRDILTDTPAANAIPSQGSEQNGCTLTDAEREAISRELSWLQWCVDNNQIGDVGRMDIATLRGLLERTA